MKKRFLLQPLTVGLAAALFAVPVFAQEQSEVAQNAAVLVEAANVSVPQAEPVEEVVQAKPENKLAQYLGKTITKQSVIGSTVLSEEEVLAVVKTKPGMELTEIGLSEDLGAIYDMGWFYDLRPEFKEVPEGVQVVYHVLENPTYSKLNLVGNTVIDKQKVNALFNLEEGSVVNLKDINRRVLKLEEEFRQAGYILARVTDVHMDQDGTLNLTVNEGIVEDFKVKGNVKTKDYVITREMRLKKGQPFNAKDARRSMQRIYNLGYFEDVNVKLNPGKEPNSVEVEVSVVEMNTGTFGIGAGYSSADGFVGMISIGDKNFRGIGDAINIRWEFGGEDNKNYDFSYTRPWLDDKETRATINLYDITNEYADYNIDGDEIARYDKKRRGQELTLSRRAEGEFISNYITIKNRDDIYEGEADGYEKDPDQYYEPQFNDNKRYWEDYYPADYKERRKENFGVTRSITLGRVLDSRDNVYDPHEGKRISYSIEHAGFMGGDFDFTKFTADYRYYYRAGGEAVWALNLGAGYADGDMPLSQRFSMGGSDTLRGYEDDQFRGNSMVKATLEYRFPIVKKVQGVLFTDNGYAWDKRFQDDFDFGLIKNSFGVGLRINSPLGPVKLDYGYGDEGGKFHFSFGGQF
ncbi:MAG: BamA/TamA family outer membrane protein [Phascolarctobacterium sp.]|nr:BamA/TamA family outer membrane protein [Phascolarctobacterium sp.]